MTIKENNEKLLENYSGATKLLVLNLVDIEKEKIKSISFEPFENIEIKRRYDELEAYQKVEDTDGVNIYLEPVEPYPGNRIVFIKDIPEKNISKGDTGILSNIRGINSKRAVADFEVTLDNNKTVVVNSLSCVLDTNYKFLYVARIPITGKQYSNLQNIDYLKEESHFADADKSILCAIRVKGNITNEIATQAKELFYSKYINAKRLEEEGRFAYLVLSSFPNGSKNKELLNDSYILHKHTHDLEVNKLNKKFKM